MKILLTGSTGYIGRQLLKRLMPTHEVIEVCRTTGYDLSQSGWTLHLPNQNVDVVIHLAQSRHYREFPAGAEDMFRVNVASTFDLLDWARHHNVKHFVFVSTGNVYKPSGSKLSESAECLPVSMYGASKLAAEILLHPFSTFFQISIPRLFGVYGPNQNQMLIADMIARVRTGQTITLAGGVGLHLTPMFVDDCISALMGLLTAGLPQPVTVLNFAGDQVLSLGEIVNEIGQQLSVEPCITVTSELPRYFCADNTALKTYWRDFTSFAAGLRMTLRLDEN
ncbi:MAG: NAD(P)-dependent oxidoreductase [Chloroflexi bacterium]|nr:NAD(P)-dependent oxidoreductase [Chloroflexota bacterium]